MKGYPVKEAEIGLKQF